MLPVKITVTPTMLVFNELHETQHLHLVEDFKLSYSDKDHYFYKGTPEKLYKMILKLSYDYDIEIS